MRIDIGDGFQIRSFAADDVDALVKYANNRKIWLNLRDIFPHPYTKEDAEYWLKHVKEQKPEAHFAISSNDECIGELALLYNPM